MTIEVQAPDGSTVEFPDGTDGATIHGVMSQHFGSRQPTTPAPSSASFGSMQTFSPIQEKAVPPPAAGQSFSELSRNATQRARNTALGTGPGSIGKDAQGQGLPGIALAPAGVGAEVSGAAAWRAFNALPASVQALVIMGGAGAAKQVGVPDWLVHWAENAGLIKGFGKHNP